MITAAATGEDTFRSIDPLAFLLAPTPTHTHAAPEMLEVAQVFGDAILDIRHYAPGAVVRVGVDAAFLAPADALGADEHVLVTHEAGEWICHVLPAWAGFVDDGRDREHVYARTGTAGRLRLASGEVLVLDLGPTLLVIRVVPRPARIPGAPLDIDPTLFSLASMVGLLAIAAAMVGSRVEPSASASSREEMVAAVYDVFLQRPPTPQPAKARAPSAAAAGGSSRAALRRSPRPGDAITSAGILDDIATALEGVFSEPGLNGDVLAAARALQGPSTAGLPGVEGLSARCGGGPCSGFASRAGDGIGDVGTGRHRGEAATGGVFERTKSGGGPSDIAGEPILLGTLDRADVDRVVRQHLREIKYCYQRQLQREPGLSGKVTVRFVIARDGSVSSATTKSSTLGSGAAETCINGRFLRMQFPEPKGGGIVIVTYPFVFAEA